VKVIYKTFDDANMIFIYESLTGIPQPYKYTTRHSTRWWHYFVSSSKVFQRITGGAF